MFVEFIGSRSLHQYFFRGYMRHVVLIFLKFLHLLCARLRKSRSPDLFVFKNDVRTYESIGLVLAFKTL